MATDSLDMDRAAAVNRQGATGYVNNRPSHASADHSKIIRHWRDRSWIARLSKSTMDRGVALVSLIFLAPLLLTIAVLVKLSSPGPALFKQSRHGLDEKPFQVLKFRTMYVETCAGGAADKVVQAQRVDPRITPLGRFLRRSSLDELPQLINVLRGEMSLVGPRPHAISHDVHYSSLIPHYRLRHNMMPGITGLAQVKGFRGGTETLESMERRIDLDLEYIQNWSLALDVKIMVMTLFTTINDSNAY
ncbi:putative colanic acid biosysnthesis UDP-glucose lipid carrier transferase [Arboricoccus pini]|uniref:Putative colanic acid biosysnthesis UDP-glucose lipid carrier transferase n=1 Tax=Arboricoccus pini TaxID=1963835 RepID=A0A212S4E3_9PROT|nr:exopolysaccharide biosynthesis polyprenyl glycosylphosphotransferase [Arboricoccus pini]SNB79893.1 putative colanic acid biosysnthesis UDP-glucose lipid carrier transferase [Arboricoccus pini]